MNEPDRLQPANGWARPETVRLAPGALRKHGLLFRGVARLSRLFGRPALPDIFLVMHRNPRIFWAWLMFASRLMPFGRLPAPVREKAILRVAWQCRSRYEWGQHVELALRAGVTDDEILAVTRPVERITDPDDGLLMRACDQLCRERLIDENCWRELSTRYRNRELIELIMLVGHYQMIAGLLINSGIELEAPIEACWKAVQERLAAGR